MVKDLVPSSIHSGLTCAHPDTMALPTNGLINRMQKPWLLQQLKISTFDTSLKNVLICHLHPEDLYTQLYIKIYNSNTIHSRKNPYCIQKSQLLTQYMQALKLKNCCSYVLVQSMMSSVMS